MKNANYYNKYSFTDKILEKVIKGLPKRERKIIKMRFGLEDGNIYSLRKIAKKFNLSIERIRQIEGRVISKLYYRYNLLTILNKE